MELELNDDLFGLDNLDYIQAFAYPQIKPVGYQDVTLKRMSDISNIPKNQKKKIVNIKIQEYYTVDNINEQLELPNDFGQILHNVPQNQDIYSKIQVRKKYKDLLDQTRSTKKQLKHLQFTSIKESSQILDYFTDIKALKIANLLSFKNDLEIIQPGNYIDNTYVIVACINSTSYIEYIIEYLQRQFASFDPKCFIFPGNKLIQISEKSNIFEKFQDFCQVFDPIQFDKQSVHKSIDQILSNSDGSDLHISINSAGGDEQILLSYFLYNITIALNTLSQDRDQKASLIIKVNIFIKFKIIQICLIFVFFSIVHFFFTSDNLPEILFVYQSIQIFKTKLNKISLYIYLNIEILQFIQMYQSFLPKTNEYLFLLYTAFDTVTMIKPLTSDILSNQRFMICQNFRPQIGRQIGEQLLNNYEQLQQNQSLSLFNINLITNDSLFISNLIEPLNYRLITKLISQIEVIIANHEQYKQQETQILQQMNFWKLPFEIEQAMTFADDSQEMSPQHEQYIAENQTRQYQPMANQKQSKVIQNVSSINEYSCKNIGIMDQILGQLTSLNKKVQKEEVKQITEVKNELTKQERAKLEYEKIFNKKKTKKK